MTLFFLLYHTTNIGLNHMILPIFDCLTYKNDKLAQFNLILLQFLPCTEPVRTIYLMYDLYKVTHKTTGLYSETLVIISRKTEKE